MKHKHSKLKIGDRIRIRLHDDTLDTVVYTVQGTRKGDPIIHENWQAILVKSWVKVP